MLRDKKWYVICMFVIGCVLINYAGKMVGVTLRLPIWLDSFGTMLAAYILGPMCGALVGLSVNVVYGILYSYTYIIYGVVSVAIGVIVGVCARKHWLDTLFGTLSTSFLVTVVSVAFSTPCNYIFYDGQTSNLWGDGIIAIFGRLGFNRLVSSIAGQFYLDFLDKVIMCILLFLIVRLSRIYRRTGRKGSANPGDGRIVAMVMISVLVISIFAGTNGGVVYADEAEEPLDFNSYVQTVYNGENGLPGGMANAVAQTNDGILWIGTYGGIYRYNGSAFRLMDDFDSVKSVNCLYTDEAGRLWIGTNDSGLSICINQKIANILDMDDGLGSDSVRCITQCADGKYYVGTTGSLSIVTMSGGLAVMTNIDEITYASSSAADSQGNVAVVTDAGALYLLKDNKITGTYTDEDAIYTSCQFGADDTLYVSTLDGRVMNCRVDEGQITVSDCIASSDLSNIISMTIHDDNLYLCADNGAGYIDNTQKYHSINTNQFNSSLEGMLIDYQGNYWFASSRLGLLRMCRSVFSDVCAEAGIDSEVVNSTAAWEGKLYIGMDNGLAVTDIRTGEAVTSAISEEFSGTRIRNLMVDSSDNLWIATSGKGIYEITPDNKITNFKEDKGTNGEKFRSVIELEDHTIMASGDSGITYIKNGRVTGVIGKEDGLDNPKILCLLELGEGSVLAGSDGAGIYHIRDGKITDTYTKEDGLTSEVVLRISDSQKEEGIFIVTSNGLCYMEPDGEIRSLSNFPYYNNYDVVEGDDGTLFVLSSAGVYVVDEESLLSGKQLEYTLLDSKTGLQKALTPNSWNYRDDSDNLYMSTDKGVVELNLNDYDISVRSYRVYVKNIKIDNDVESIERGEITKVKQGTSRIEIMPEIINYSVNDPYVSVWLEGFDKGPKIVRQSELTDVVYTNLEAGKYTFHLAVLDSKGQNIVSESTYVIEKEKEIYDYWWFRLYAIFVFCLAVFYVAWLVIRTQIQRTMAMQRRELEFAKNQIAMGNETVLTIARTVDAKDENTSQHSVRVSEYSVKIARKLGYDDEQCETLRKTALLHDIGKIGIPDSVLNKPSRLTDEEYEIMKSHVVKGAEILKKFTLIDNVQDGALYHHERYDGRGYVHGLKGEEIPLNARIIGIADAFDAMTANRVYRKKLDFDYVLGELRKGRGTQFDPKLVDIMLELIDDGEIDVSQLYESAAGSAKEAGE